LNIEYSFAKPEGNKDLDKIILSKKRVIEYGANLPDRDYRALSSKISSLYHL